MQVKIGLRSKDPVKKRSGYLLSATGPTVQRSQEAPLSDFKRLRVWEKAHAVALRVYAITRSFPREETYGLVSQMRRAATSVGSNLAEGCGRGARKEMAYFLRVATGSSQELRYQLILGRDLGPDGVGFRHRARTISRAGLTPRPGERKQGP